MALEQLFDSLLYTLRVLLMITIPFLAIVTVAGSLSGVLQAVTGVREELINYLCKLLTVLGLAYFFLPALISNIEEIFLIFYK